MSDRNGAPSPSGEQVLQAQRVVEATEDDLDLQTAHLAVLLGEREQWELRCFWAGVSEGPGPCALLEPCALCADALVGPDGVEYSSHGLPHAVLGGSIHAAVPGSCGLAHSFLNPTPGADWVAELVSEHGSGVYLVHPGVLPDGSMVGLSPVRVTDWPGD